MPNLAGNPKHIKALKRPLQDGPRYISGLAPAREFNFYYNDPSLCSDCPPIGFHTDTTRCADCPRRVLGKLR